MTEQWMTWAAVVLLVQLAILIGGLVLKKLDHDGHDGLYIGFSAIGLLVLIALKSNAFKHTLEQYFTGIEICDVTHLITFTFLTTLLRMLTEQFILHQEYNKRDWVLFGTLTVLSTGYSLYLLA